MVPILKESGEQFDPITNENNPGRGNTVLYHGSPPCKTKMRCHRSLWIINSYSRNVHSFTDDLVFTGHVLNLHSEIIWTLQEWGVIGLNCVTTPQGASDSAARPATQGWSCPHAVTAWEALLLPSHHGFSLPPFPSSFLFSSYPLFPCLWPILRPPSDTPGELTGPQ